jgi:hypothetical protein
MNQEELIKEVGKELGLSVNPTNAELTRQMLADRINELLNTDFQQLVSILYRQDINEPKLKLLLKENPGTDAGLIIATLMMERHLQKIKSRQQFSRRDNDINEDEKW